jgi:hypothetical protein
MGDKDMGIPFSLILIPCFLTSSTMIAIFFVKETETVSEETISASFGDPCTPALTKSIYLLNFLYGWQAYVFVIFID